jgi:hypothetical protein
MKMKLTGPMTFVTIALLLGTNVRINAAEVSSSSISPLDFSFFEQANADSTKQQRIDALKAEIIQIVTENQADLTNFEIVRSELNPLVEELAALSDASFEDKNVLKVGAWQQLWTDDADDLRGNNAFQTVDRSKTFQVVFDDGVFFNVSEIQTPLGRFTGFLKGSYEAQDPTFVLEFVDLKVKRGNTPQQGESLFNFVESAKNGTLSGLFGLPGNQRYPNGPIGARGDINTVYIDDTLRIDKGQNFADGVIDLFVLVRTK